MKKKLIIENISEKPVAVITGGAGGIGFELAKLCLKRNFNVVVADVNEDLLNKNFNTLDVQPISFLRVVCDVTNQEQVQNLQKTVYRNYGRVDWLFNNAGIAGSLGPIWELKLCDIKHTFEVNLFGYLNVIKSFLPVMFAQNHTSKIINMASIFAMFNGANIASYAMSKHAVVALSECLYFDLKRHKKPVEVSVVCPSFVNTNFLGNSPMIDFTISEKASKILQYSQGAKEAAENIISQLDQNYFYIFSNEEDKNKLLDRCSAIMNDNPYIHKVAKFMDKIF